MGNETFYSRKNLLNKKQYQLIFLVNLRKGNLL